MRFLSHVWSVARGSVGGITYTANQWHQLIARVRTVPVNPATPNQGVIRSSMAQVSSAWKGLSDANRQTWDEYAESCKYQGPLGDYSIPGRQMFTGVLAFAQYIKTRGLYALSATPTPPVIPGFFGAGPLIPATPTTVGTGIALSCTNSTGEDAVCLFERSIPFFPSRERYKGPFLSQSAVSILVPDGTSTIVEQMGLEEDKIYFTRIRFIVETPPHRLSAEYIFRHTAVVVGV